MKNSDLFIEAYNSIDNFLKKEGNYDSHVSFSQKVKNSRNKIIKNHKDELITYGELRNAIIHSNKLNDQVIAEPHEETVKRLEKIRDNILNPKKVYPTISFEVLGANENDYINKILLDMREMSFSQFPVFNSDGSIKELITTNTIARWLSSNIDASGTIIVDEVMVSSLIPEIEHKKNYKFISRNSSIFDAIELFTNHTLKIGFNLDAVFITDSGRENEKLLGLITIADITTELKNT